LIQFDKDSQKFRMTTGGRIVAIVFFGAGFVCFFNILASTDPFNMNVPAMEWKGQVAALAITVSAGFITLHQTWKLIQGLVKGNNEKPSNHTIKADEK